MNVYSSDKMAVHPLSILTLRKGEQPNPIHIQLIISDYCNQDCVFCAYRVTGYSSNQMFGVMKNGKVNNNPRRMIDLVKLREIVDDCERLGVRAIQLTGGGEPTVHPDFDELCNLIKQKKIDLALVTNGLLLKEKKAEILKDVVWVRVSIDCSNRESYSRIRSVPEQEFDVVEKNVRRLASISGRKVFLGVGFVVTKDNFKEVEEACKKFKDWGVDNVRISAVFQNEGADYFKYFYRETRRGIDRAKELQDKNFVVFDNFGERVEDLILGNPDYDNCGIMHTTSYLGADLNLYTCCVYAYNERGLIGSIKDQSLYDLWNSPEKKQFFSSFNARDCERCQFNGKNRYIEALVKEPTGHENFV